MNREIVDRLENREGLIVTCGVPGESEHGRDDVVVRHTWPVLHPPSGARWVAMQPWEFGSIPKLWFDPFVFGADEIWVYSEFNRQVYVEAGVPAEKVHVIPLGIQDVYLQSARAPFPLNTKKRFRFLFVGGTVQRKGIDLLLSAYRRCFSASDDVCLVIKDFGRGSFYKGQTAEHHIRELQRDPGSPEIEYLTDDMDAASLRDLYHSCHCLVHPYRGEGFGLPIAEAMACGLPAIVPEQGGAADFCPEGCCIRLPVQRRRVPVTFDEEVATLGEPWWMEVDPRQLGESMRAVVAAPAETAALGRRAQAWIRPRFTWEHTVAAVEARLAALREVERPLAEDLGRQAELLTRIGVLRWEQGNADAALRYFARALELERSDDHLYNVAALLAAKGDRRSAGILFAELERRVAEAGTDPSLLEEVRAARRGCEEGEHTERGHGQLRWYAPLYNASGYADESRNFLLGVAAESPMEIRIEAVDRGFGSRVVDGAVFDLLERLANQAPLPTGVDYQHCPPSIFQYPQGSVSIARTMFETDRISGEWAERCNLFSEVWVPSEFNRETFARSGVVREKIRVLPGCLDMTKYEASALPHYPLPPCRSFRFVSVFDFSPRKGWDVLLDAYFREFSAADDVTLVVKVTGILAQDRTPAEQVREFVSKRGFANAPHLVFIDAKLREDELLGLYAACDAFVLPSRGEGWGRPYMEAMALGLPTIGTRWSANLAFMNDENSFLVDIEGLEACEAQWDDPAYRGHCWAVPSVASLRQQMRLVFEDRTEAKRRGERARRDIAERFDRPIVTKEFLNRLASACGPLPLEVDG